MQDPPTVMTDDEEALQKAEGDGGHREEVHGRDGFAVIVQKAEPSTSGFWIFGCAFHPARNGSFRDIETQHE